MTTVSRDELFVQLGSSRFQVDRTWTDGPPGRFLGRVIDVAADRFDRIYVCQRYDFSVYRGPAPTIHVFDPEGTYLAGWESPSVQDAHHIHVDGRDRVFVVDRNGHQVIAFDTSGNELFTIGERGRPGAPFNHPTSIAVAPSGRLYVSDGYGGHHVHRFSPDGELEATWGGPGRGPGQFTTPHGIWITSDGRVHVGDREANRVQIFSPDGDYLGELDGMFHPMSVHGDEADNIYVSDQSPRLILFDREGGRVGACSPVLREGHGICGDSRGNIYLTDMNPERVTRLTAVTSVNEV